MIPYPPYLGRLAIRTALLWVLVQVMIFGVMGFIPAWTPHLVPSLGFPAVLAMVDRRLANETILHANLGAAQGWFWAVSLLTSLTVDGIVILARTPG